MTGAATGAPGRTSGRVKLVALMTGLFALPFLVTALLFAIDWRPARPAHHGELLAGTTREPLPPAGLSGLDHSPLPAPIAGHWTLAVAVAGPCGEACQARLDSVRRIHVALYKQMPRVKRLLLTSAAADEPTLRDIARRYPDLVVATPAAAPWQRLLEEQGRRPGAPDLIVIDPAGRAVMRYAGDFDARGALRDIDRLLKYSWIG